MIRVESVWVTHSVLRVKGALMIVRSGEVGRPPAGSLFGAFVLQRQSGMGVSDLLTPLVLTAASSVLKSPMMRKLTMVRRRCE